MDTRPHRGPSAAGYAIVLLGVLGYVVGYFLPYADGEPFQEMWLGHGLGIDMWVLGGAAIVGTIALWAISRPRAWTPYALVPSAAAWALPWFIILINHGRLDQISFVEFGVVHSGALEVGWWVLLASLGVAMIGAVVVLVSARRTVHEPRAPEMSSM